MSWKRNLVFIWLSQFFSIMGFSFALPYAPFFIQELGIHEPSALKMWVAAFAAATPLSLAVFSPIWGALADRYGRRLMLLRANCAACVVMSLMGFAQSVQMLVMLRVLQGVFTGTMTAAQAMVASTAPEERSGLALGALSASVFSGSMTGHFLGGICAHYFGYRTAFFLSGFLLLTAGLLVLLGTHEPMRPPVPIQLNPHQGLRPLLKGAAFPILLMILFVAFARQFDVAYLPLRVQEIHGRLEGVSLWAGSLAAVGGIAGLLAGLLLGRLSDRHPPPRIGQFAALGAALWMIPQALAQGFLLLFVARFGVIFCSGGLDPVLQIWLSKVTPPARRGFVFGWAATARSIGWMLAPVFAGLLAARHGLQAVFHGSIICYLLLIPAIALCVRLTQRRNLRLET